RHGAVDGIDLLGLHVYEAVVDEKEEELVPAVEEPGHAHRAADRTRAVVRAPAWLPILRTQLIGERRISGSFGLFDARPVTGIGCALRGVVTLLPVLPGELSVIIVG